MMLIRLLLKVIYLSFEPLLFWHFSAIALNFFFFLLLNYIHLKRVSMLSNALDQYLKPETRFSPPPQ